MKYLTLFFRKLGKMFKNLSSATVVIGALRVNRMGVKIRPFSKINFPNYANFI